MNNVNGEIIAFSVQKGGVGKSTTAQMVAYNYAKRGNKTLLIDMDPQATLTSAFFGYSYESFTKDDVSNITRLFKKENVKPIQIRTSKFVDNPEKGKMLQPHFLEEDLEIDFIPCNYELLDVIESDELKRADKIELIFEFLVKLKESYDKIIVDGPPSFGIITTAILRASDFIVTPIAAKNVDISGMVGFIRRLDIIVDTYKDMDIKKIVFLPNMYDGRLNDCKEALADIKRVPNLFQETKKLRDLNCVIADKFPTKSSVQEAPAYKLFLEPYIMNFAKGHKDIILRIDRLVNELKAK
jgi:cellulose biosynthesis protein BcsQ